MGRLTLVGVFASCVLGACGDDGFMMPPDRTALCTAQLAMSGSIAAPAAPDPTLGCQPAGTWTINVQVSDMGTCSAVNVPATVTISVTGDAHNETITHTPATGEDDSLQINGDNDACNGNFELVIPDGSQFDQIELQPHTGDFCPMKMVDA